MVLHPIEECVVAGLDEYDSLKNLEVGNYDQRYYVEKEDLRIDFLSEDDEEDQEVEEVEDDLSQLKLHEDPPKAGNVFLRNFRQSGQHYLLPSCSQPMDYC